MPLDTTLKSIAFIASASIGVYTTLVLFRGFKRLPLNQQHPTVSEIAGLRSVVTTTERNTSSGTAPSIFPPTFL